MCRFAVLLWVLSCGLCGLPAAATTVYRCTAAGGRVIYQDKPCASSQRQRVLALPDAPPPSGSTIAPTVPAETSGEPTEPPAPSAPTAPLPLTYACTRATDGQTYLSGNGHPPPYRAPFGMLGAVQLPLSQVYGPTRGGAGISAPEANRGRVTSGLVADNYVWVQDRCRQLTPAETCGALRDAYDENARKLERAFKSDRPPLEKRDAELQAQLTNCN